jgi:tetratricopeptide (TPR) repeat protein
MLQARDRDTAQRQFAQPNPARLAKMLLDAPTVARRNAPPAQGAFPLILHSLGLNDFQQESTVLWEYLASHGYIVATVPQLGPSLLHARLALALPDLQLQQRDLEFALAEMFLFPAADPSRLAVMGHSAGGIVALFVASQNSSVDAVVSLDGSIMTKDGRAVLDAAGFDAARLRAPLLNLYRASETHRLDYAVNSLKYADRYNLAFQQATHFDFQNWPLYSIFSETADPRGAPFRPAETGREVFLAVCRYVRHFLHATLNHDASSLPHLKGPMKTEKPVEELVSFHFHEGVKIPRAEDLAWMLSRGEVEPARQAFQAARARYPQETIIEERSFSALGAELLGRNQTEAATAAFQCVAAAYSASPGARLNLAEAYRQGGRKQEAIAEYEKAIQLTENSPGVDAALLQRIRQRATERLSQLHRRDSGAGNFYFVGLHFKMAADQAR